MVDVDDVVAFVERFKHRKGEYWEVHRNDIVINSQVWRAFKRECINKK